MSSSRLRVLVSGASGFIGSHLVDRLTSRGHVVYALDKVNGTSTADFSNLIPFVGCRLDRIVHLGASASSQISIRDPRTDFTDNLIGTFNICELARLAKVAIIFNSTMKIYPGDDGLISPYGLSKKVGEMYIREYHELYDVPFVINRPSSVYGPRQNGTEDGGWLSWFVKASLMNERITLFGNGTQSRDALYIDDHIDLLVEEVEEFNSFKNEDFDFGGGQTNEVTLLEALKYLRYENYTFAARLPGDIQRFVCDNEKIKQYTAWCPKIQWKVGVDRTVEYLSNTSRK